MSVKRGMGRGTTADWRDFPSLEMRTEPWVVVGGGLSGFYVPLILGDSALFFQDMDLFAS